LEALLFGFDGGGVVVEVAEAGLGVEVGGEGGDGRGGGGARGIAGVAIEGYLDFGGNVMVGVLVEDEWGRLVLVDGFHCCIFVGAALFGSISIGF
jgi:hypothetical protein